VNDLRHLLRDSHKTLLAIKLHKPTITTIDDLYSDLSALADQLG